MGKQVEEAQDGGSLLELARDKGELGSEEAGGTGVHGARWMGEYAQRTIKGRNQ